MNESAPEARSSMGKVLAISIVIAALVGGTAGFGAGVLSRPAQASGAREFYVFPNELPFNDTVAGVPHYVFIPDRIIVNKGDVLTLHFYDTTDEDHTFTMVGPYTTDVVVSAATNTTIDRKDINFTATVTGTFTYRCRFHSPTMTGTLVVLG